MAEKPVKENLPADLPTDWVLEQVVTPGGTEAGLSPQHGYNYLAEQVNAAQRAAKQINEAFGDLSTAASVAFTASEWQGGKLTIPQERHGRHSAAFGYQLRHKVEGTLVTNTWAVLGTAVSWPGDNTIVLESEDAYDGEITFFG